MESKNNWKAWLYLAPTLILLSVFTFYPILNTIFVSFLKDYNSLNGTYSGFTLDNYISVLTPWGSKGGGLGSFFHIVMQTALPNTLLLTIVTVPLSIIFSLIIAICLNSIKFFKKIFQTVFFMPYVTNAIAIGMVFSVVFNADYGIFNSIFKLGNFPWIARNEALDSPSYWSAFFAICVYIVWHSLPYKILIFLGGLQNIDKQYYEAAQVDGAGKFKSALKITVPLLSPQIMYMLITSFIGAFKEYNSVVGLFGADNAGSFNPKTGPRNMQTMVYFIYDQLKQPFNVSYACAGAVFLFIIIMIFTAIQFKVGQKRVHY